MRIGVRLPMAARARRDAAGASAADAASAALHHQKNKELQDDWWKAIRSAVNTQYWQFFKIVNDIELRAGGRIHGIIETLYQRKYPGVTDADFHEAMIEAGKRNFKNALTHKRGNIMTSFQVAFFSK